MGSPLAIVFELLFSGAAIGVAAWQLISVRREIRADRERAHRPDGAGRRRDR